MADEPDTYPSPVEGWNCFHCGEHFPPHGLGIARAKEHFGDYAFATPACQIWGKQALTWRSGYRKLIRALRDAETDRNEVRRQLGEDDTEKDRQIYRMQSDHAAALRQAEEDGYAKGLRDGRAMQAAE